MKKFIKRILEGVPSDDSVSLKEKEFLYDLIIKHKPKLFLEIGTHRAQTALYIAQALYDNKKGKLITVDPYPWDSQANIDKFPELAEIIEYRQMKGEDITDNGLDIVFVDGYHEKEIVLKEIHAIMPLLSKKAVMVFHDTNGANILCDPVGAIREAGLETKEVPTENGIHIYYHV